MVVADHATEFHRKHSFVTGYEPVITTSIYAAGDAVGGLQTISSIVNADNFGGFIHSVVVTEKATTTTNKDRLDLVFFDGNPTASTVTDNAPLVIAAADIDKVIGTIPVAAADYIDVDGTVLAAATVRGAGFTFITSGGNDLFVAIRCGGTPTYTGTDDLQVKIGVVQG